VSRRAPSMALHPMILMFAVMRFFSAILIFDKNIIS